MDNEFNYDMYDNSNQENLNQVNYNNESPIVNHRKENKFMKIVTKILFLIIVIILAILLLINFGVIKLNEETNFVITLSHNELGIKLKKSHQLMATVYPDMIQHDKIIWTSSDESVVSVNESTGYLTAHKLGEAVITASIGDDVKSECKVHVSNKDISLSKIELNNKEIEMFVGNNFTINYNIVPKNANFHNVEFKSSDESVVSVNNKGVVKALREGQAIVTISAYNGNISSSLKIKVKRKKVEVNTQENIKTKISISEKNIKIIEGGSKKIVAKLEPSNVNEVVNWQSENTSIATVNKNGLVKGIKEGIVNIIASLSNGESVICKVEVEKAKEIELKGLEIIGSTSIEMGMNERKRLLVSFNPTNASNQIVTWESSNVNVIKVTDDGELIPINQGMASITVKSFNGKYKDTVQVKVNVPQTTIDESSIKFEKAEESIILGKTKTLIPTILPANATNKNVTWSSSNPKVASVEDGLVKALQEGETTITATTVNKKLIATIKIKVTAIKVTGVNIIENDISTSIGDTETLNATVLPSNATNKKVVWSSSNSAVATIDGNGKITAKAQGTTVITVKTVDGNYEDKINVTVKPSVVLVTGVQTSPNSLIIESGSSKNFAVTILPTNATNKSFTCISSDSNITTASVDGSNCKIVGVSKGTAQITVYSHDNQYNAVVNVAIEEAKNKVNINVATWNIRRYKDAGRDKIAEKIATLNLDIIGLQETRTFADTDEKEENNTKYVLGEIGKKTGLNNNYYTHTPAGNAIMTKRTVVSNNGFGLASCYETRSLQKTVINVNNVNISFYNTHLSYQENCPQIQLESAYNIIKNDVNPVILVGDFNVGPPTVLTNTLGSEYKIVAYDTVRQIYADSIIINGKGKLQYVEGSGKTVVTTGTLSDHNLVMATLSVIN